MVGVDWDERGFGGQCSGRGVFLDGHSIELLLLDNVAVGGYVHRVHHCSDVDHSPKNETNYERGQKSEHEQRRKKESLHVSLNEKKVGAKKHVCWKVYYGKHV